MLGGKAASSPEKKRIPGHVADIFSSDVREMHFFSIGHSSRGIFIKFPS